MKKEKLKIEWFTEVAGLPKVESVVPAIKAIPDWVKKIPMHSMETNNPNQNPHRLHGTIKQCPGFIDLYKQSYVIPMWCDLKIKASRKGMHSKFSDTMYEMSIHPPEQLTDHLPPDRKDDYIWIAKTLTPWRARTSPGWGMLQLPMQYEYNPDFFAAMGIVHTDHFHELNIQLYIKHDREFIITKGTPIAMYVPIKLYKNLEIEESIGPATQEQFEFYETGHRAVFSKFTQGYKALIQQWKEF